MRHRRSRLRRRYGRAHGSPRVVSRGAMGGYQWSVPSAPGMRLTWYGPGSRLWLVMSTGVSTPIDYPASAAGTFNTAHEASKAVKRFFDAK